MMGEYDEDTSSLDAQQAGYDDFNEFCAPDDLCPFEAGHLREAYREGWMTAFAHMGEEEE